jgi:aarF domain-containing kinase
VETRAALAFLLSDKGNFFREFLLDEVLSRSTKDVLLC